MWWLLWAGLASAPLAQECNRSGCAATERDAMGCCPRRVVAVRRPTRPAAPSCPAGMSRSADTSGRCCWPGQGWNGERCVGAPACVEPHVAAGESCRLPLCPDGQLRMRDDQTCCWPDQALSGGRCVGVPSCPAERVLLGEDCLAAAECPAGLAQTPDRLHCCWPGQEWVEGCYGVPASCPEGRETYGETCGLAPAWLALPAGSITLSDSGVSRSYQLTVGLEIMTAEVTQAQYASIMGHNPSQAGGFDRPVERVSWLDAVAYANARSLSEGLRPAYTIEGSAVSWDRAADGYRLPTETEWLYAVRAAGSLPEGSGCSDRGGGETAPVTDQELSPSGLWGSCGNVSEWVWDWYHEGLPRKLRDPSGPRLGTRRIVRGGSWRGGHHRRSGELPTESSSAIGFRLVRPIR